jgi:hypothetical protein
MRSSLPYDLYQLWKYDAPEELREAFILHHGASLYGADKFENMRAHLLTDEDERTQCINFCLEALYGSGYYDDPSDRRRTMSNLEEAAILYIDRWDFHRHPIWIRDKNDPTSDVGIEVAFDLVITYTYESGRVREYRFIGKFDGIQWRDEVYLTLVKTKQPQDLMKPGDNPLLCLLKLLVTAWRRRYGRELILLALSCGALLSLCLSLMIMGVW